MKEKNSFVIANLLLQSKEDKFNFIDGIYDFHGWIKIYKFTNKNNNTFN